MKKLLAILLCIVMMLSMVACGGNQDNNETPNTTQNSNQNNSTGNGETTIVQPTAEEWEAMDKYNAILKALKDYEEYGNISIEYSYFGIESDNESVYGNDALAFCYEQLTKLEAVDKWVGSDYMSAALNRQDVLDSFVIIENVLLSEEKAYQDILGNSDSGWTNFWTYNTDGTVFSTAATDCFDPSDAHPWKNRCLLEQVISNPGGLNTGYPFYVYNANGQIEKIEYAYSAGDTINAVRKFTYSGDLISSEQIISADGTEQSVSYTYDSNNQVTEITTIWGLARNRLKYTFTYEYNDQGQIICEKVIVEQEDYYNENTYGFYREAVTNYTYDSNGNLSSGVCACTEKWNNGKATATDRWTYSCDDQGRIVSVDMTCGDLITESGEVAWKVDYPTCNFKFAYGNYYIYNPAK